MLCITWNEALLHCDEFVLLFLTSQPCVFTCACFLYKNVPHPVSRSKTQCMASLIAAQHQFLCCCLLIQNAKTLKWCGPGVCRGCLILILNKNALWQTTKKRFTNMRGQLSIFTVWLKVYILAYISIYWHQSCTGHPVSAGGQ